MRSAFATVLWVVCGLGIIGAVVALVTSSKTWEELGKGRLVMDRDPHIAPRPGSQAATIEHDAEIRQLLGACNARRQRRGEPPLDVELELQRLTARPIDAELRAEIRDLVLARSHRRARHGEPPLDVEAEIERQIAALGPIGS